METEKSHDLMSANWRSRKTNSIISLSLKAWEPGEPIRCKPQLTNQKDGECENVRWAQGGMQDAKQDKFLLPLPIVLFRLSRGWMMPTNIIEFIDTSANLIRKHPRRYTQNLHPPIPMAMIHKINHHSIQRIITKWIHLCNLCLLPETTLSNFSLSLSHPFPGVYHPIDTQHFRLV